MSRSELEDVSELGEPINPRRDTASCLLESVMARQILTEQPDWQARFSNVFKDAGEEET